MATALEAITLATQKELVMRTKCNVSTKTFWSDRPASEIASFMPVASAVRLTLRWNPNPLPTGPLSAKPAPGNSE